MVVVFVGLLILINRGAWAIGEMMAPNYLFGFVTGMGLTILWFRFVHWLEKR